MAKDGKNCRFWTFSAVSRNLALIDERFLKIFSFRILAEGFFFDIFADKVGTKTFGALYF